MLDKFERKIGKYAIKNLIFYIIAGYVIGYLLYFTDDRLGLYQYITLSPDLVMKGQVWRLFTWVLSIPDASLIWAVVMLFFFYTIGRGLESSLGAFKYNVYIFSGWFFMTLGSMIFYWVSLAISHGTGGVSLDISTYYINMASFLAFAVLYPDMRVLLFFIIPVRMKILAILDAIYLGYVIISDIFVVVSVLNDSTAVFDALSYYGFNYSKAYLLMYGLSGAFSIIISLLNFLIFFLATRKSTKGRSYGYNASSKRTGTFYARRTGPSAGNKRTSAAGEARKKYNPDFQGQILHRCEICGRTSKDFPNLQFRYCSKCSGNHEYCEDHIFTHEHIKGTSNN